MILFNTKEFFSKISTSLQLRPIPVFNRIQVGKQIRKYKKQARKWLTHRSKYVWKIIKNFKLKARPRKRYLKLIKILRYNNFLVAKETKTLLKIPRELSSYSTETKVIQKLRTQRNKIERKKRKKARKKAWRLFFSGNRRSRRARKRCRLMLKRIRKRKKQQMKKDPLGQKVVITFNNMWIDFYHRNFLKKIANIVPRNIVVYRKKFLFYWIKKLQSEHLLFLFLYSFLKLRENIELSSTAPALNLEKTTFSVVVVPVNHVYLFIYIMTQFSSLMKFTLARLLSLKKKHYLAFRFLMKPNRKRKRKARRKYLRGYYVKKKESQLIFLSRNFLETPLFLKLKLKKSRKRLPRVNFIRRFLKKVQEFSNYKLRVLSATNLIRKSFGRKKDRNIIMRELIFLLRQFKRKKTILRNGTKINGVEKKRNKLYLRYLYAFLNFNLKVNEQLDRHLFSLYNLWMFYINYSLNYYLFSKLYFMFLNYFFYFMSQKFSKLKNVLKLKKLELCYDLIKAKDNSRYHLGMRPHTFITTINRRLKKGFKLKKIISDLEKLLGRFLAKNQIKGYYLRVKGRFKRGRRKGKILRRKGFIAFNSLHLKLNSCYGLLYTRFGIAGVKIVFSY